MRNYALRLDKFGITKNRYRELEFFCLQYPDKKQKLDMLLHGTSSPTGGQPSGQGVSDPTAHRALMIGGLLSDCEDVEQAAIEAVDGHDDRVLYQWLIRYMTKETKPFISEIPCGRRQFYEMRRRFFCALHKRRSPRGNTFVI